jgi:tRNA(Ile)-lysidine synthase
LISTAQIRSAEAVVSETIEREKLFEEKDRILVAFSGGADSSALAIVLSDLGFDVMLGHIDHRLQPLSSQQALRSAEIAERLGIVIHSAVVSVYPPSESEARRVRYSALEEMADRVGASFIATGHTLDDQAETVLLRLGRGGRAVGIPYKRGRIVRPLLDIRRSDTELICGTKGIEFLRDPTNEDPRFRRNLIRHRVLPQFSDDVILHLAHMAGRHRHEADAVGRTVDELWRSSVRVGPERISIDRNALKDAGKAGLVVRAALVEAGIEATGRLVEDVVSKVVPETGSRLQLPGGLWAWTEPHELVIGRIVERHLPDIQLSVPGAQALPHWGLRISSELVEPRVVHGDDFVATFDFDRLGAELLVRSRHEGDRFRPLGLSHERKIQNFFVDEKVPRYERDSVPLLISGGEIAWVVGHRIGDSFKVTETTRRAIRFEVQPI